MLNKHVTLRRQYTDLYAVRNSLSQCCMDDDERFTRHGAVCETETPLVGTDSPSQFRQIPDWLDGFVCADLNNTTETRNISERAVHPRKFDVTPCTTTRSR